MKTIDINKPVQTRDGRKVTDLHKLSEPIFSGKQLMGVVEHPPGNRFDCTWHEDGTFSENSTFDGYRVDLINVPERMVRWANVYSGTNGVNVALTVDSPERADRVANDDRIGLFKYTFVEGQDPRAEFVPLEEAK